MSASSVDHVSTRLDAGIVARLDALAVQLAPLGVKPARSIAVRACLLTGLEVLEKQHNAKPPGAP